MSVCLVVPSANQSDIRPAVVRGPSLEDRVQRRFFQSPYLALRHVSVEVRQGVLTLSGQMPNFYLKQMAQAAAATVEGVESIINRIEVVEPAY